MAAAVAGAVFIAYRPRRSDPTRNFFIDTAGSQAHKMPKLRFGLRGRVAMSDARPPSSTLRSA